MGKLPQILTLAIIVTAASVLTNAARLAVKDDNPFALPENFMIGAGVSAIQSEGAWDEDNKLESAADHVMHLGKLGPLQFGDPHEHDVAANSYHRYKEDVAAAKQLGLELYRFSMSWGRVFFEGQRNEKGIQYYHDLIKEIKDNGMKPLATLYHFDHPQTYEDQFKGWQSEKMIDKFVEYAKFMFDEYGKEVDLWVTINEANMYCAYFPTLFVMSGLYTEEQANIYDCMRNTLLAHARSYRAFKEAGHTGKVGHTALLMTATANTTSPEDVYAAELFNEAHAGQSLAPVVHGDYPQILKDALGDKLKEFTEEEKTLIKGSADFLGFNVYFSMLAAWWNADPNVPNPSSKIPVTGRIIQDLPMLFVVPAGNIRSPLEMFTMIAPDALRNAILWTWDSYKMPILITENGFGDSLSFGKHDHIRASYHSAFLRTLITTMKEFKANVFGYCAWSLIDSFEWSAGYSRPFGLIHVDYEGKTLDRSLKDSSEFWIQLTKTRVVPLVEEPTTIAPITSTATVPTSTAKVPTSTPSAAPVATPLTAILLLLLVAAVFQTL